MFFIDQNFPAPGEQKFGGMASRESTVTAVVFFPLNAPNRLYRIRVKKSVSGRRAKYFTSKYFSTEYDAKSNIESFCAGLVPKRAKKLDAARDEETLDTTSPKGLLDEASGMAVAPDEGDGASHWHEPPSECTTGGYA